MQETHFIRYFPYHFDTNDPYYLGNSDITKSSNYNYSTQYYSISDDNFYMYKNNQNSFNDDYYWRSQTRNPYPSLSTKKYYHNSSELSQISTTSKVHDLYYSDKNYYHQTTPTYKNISDFHSQINNPYNTKSPVDLTPSHHYQSIKSSDTTPTTFYSPYLFNTDDDDSASSTDLTFNHYSISNKFQKTAPSTDLTATQHSKNIHFYKTAPSTDLTANSHYHHTKSRQPINTYSKFTKSDRDRQKIARENHDFVRNHSNLIDTNFETIDEVMHSNINRKITRPPPQSTPIIVTRFSTIDTAIYYHNQGFSKICVLNFSDATKVGGGYLNGRNAQEESLCRQTLLYPTLKASTMHEKYRESGNIYESDFMLYSPNVFVIRDNSDAMIEIPFKINIISAPAVDKRNYVKNADMIMERRIRKIVKLAAYKKNSVLVLGAFGCGVFKNSPNHVSKIFKKILIGEGLKDYFKLIVFPIYKDDNCKKIFESEFL